MWRKINMPIMQTLGNVVNWTRTHWRPIAAVGVLAGAGLVTYSAVTKHQDRNGTSSLVMDVEEDKYTSIVLKNGRGRTTFSLTEEAEQLVGNYMHLKRLSGHSRYGSDDLARLLYAIDTQEGEGNLEINANEVRQYVEAERAQLKTDFTQQVKPRKYRFGK